MSNSILNNIQTLSDPRMFISHYLMSYPTITVSDRGELTDTNHPDKNHVSITRSIFLDYLNVARTFNSNQKTLHPNARNQAPLFKEREISYVIQEIIEKRILENRLLKASTLKCNKQDLNPMKAFVKALGCNDELSLAVLSHYVWMIKRKFMGMPVKNHIVPVILGPQGVGKTIAIGKLISPMDNYKVNVKLSTITDERYHLASQYGMSTVQGHFHEKAQITYISTPEKLMFDAHTGCLADDDSLALGYNKINPKRPIVSILVIVNGVPQLIPMILDKKSRWINKL